MPRAKRSKKSPPPSAPKSARAGRLFTDPQVSRPLPSLIVLSPLLAFYAFGLIWARPDLAVRADILVRQAIAPLGLTGVLAPTWLVIGVLLAWHLVRRDPWRVSGKVLGLMAAETALLTVPLFAILAASSVILHGYFSLELAAPRPPATAWLAVAMTSIGAGIYEELLFRLVLVGGPLWIARQIFRWESSGFTVAVVLVAAAIFSGAHTLDNPRWFVWDLFLFRTTAGAYLGYVFARRGFGIAVGAHIVFDLIVKLAMVFCPAA